MGETNKPAFPQTPDGVTDWEKVFEDPDQGLVAAIRTAQTSDNLRACMMIVIRQLFTRDDWFAPVASGSASPSSMVICPASGGCISAIANGASNNLIERAADVAIKERRQLILVPRETPVSAIHLENQLKLARLGVTLLPASPGFYQQPKTVDDMVDFVVARVLDQLGIDQTLLPRWGE